MKTSLLITVLLTLTFNIWAQVQEKTFVKSFKTEGFEKLLLDVEGPVVVKKWDNHYCRVQMEVSLATPQATLLKSLVTTGRYHLMAQKQAEMLRIFAPGLDKQLKIEEVVTYTVYMPASLEIELPESSEAVIAKGK